MSIYVGQFVLIAGASPRQELQSDPFAALREMSVFAPLVTVGVFAATVSSALGSFLGAPRILQAMGHDRLMLPMVFFGKGSGAQVRLLRLVRSEAEAHEARRTVTALRDNARIVATVEIIQSDESPWEMIPRTSGPTADVVMLGMSAAGGAEARQTLQSLRPMLEQLPTTLIVWSNGDANVFA